MKEVAVLQMKINDNAASLSISNTACHLPSLPFEINTEMISLAPYRKQMVAEYPTLVRNLENRYLRAWLYHASINLSLTVMADVDLSISDMMLCSMTELERATFNFHILIKDLGRYECNISVLLHYPHRRRRLWTYAESNDQLQALPRILRRLAPCFPYIEEINLSRIVPLRGSTTGKSCTQRSYRN